MRDQTSDTRKELDRLYEQNEATYRRFVFGSFLFAAHILVILAILAYVTL